MELSFRIENEYATVVSELEAKFSSYLVAQNNPPEGIPAKVYRYFPHRSSFANKWPVLAAAELPPEGGEARMSDADIRLTALRIGVRIYQPSIIVPENVNEAYHDAREAAKRITRAVWSNWLTAFQADDSLPMGREIATVEFGDESRVGNPFYLDDRGSRLWIHSTEVVLPL